MQCLSGRSFNVPEEAGSQILSLGFPLLQIPRILMGHSFVTTECPTPLPKNLETLPSSLQNRKHLWCIQEGNDITRHLHVCVYVWGEYGRDGKWEVILLLGEGETITESFVGIRSHRERRLWQENLVSSLYFMTGWVKVLRNCAPGSLLQSCLLFFLLLKMSHHLCYFLNSSSVDR